MKPGTRRRRIVAMAGDGRRTGSKPEGCPRQHVGQGSQLSCRNALLVEVTVAADEEMPGRVVLGEGVAPRKNRSAFIDVAVGVDQVVIGNVRPPPPLVVVLVRADPTRRASIAAHHDGGVVDGHSLDPMLNEKSPDGSGAPGVPANDFETARRSW